MSSALRRTVATAAILSALALGAVGATAAPAYQYPAAFERSFLASCNAASHGLNAKCLCALRWIERRYTYRQIVTIFLHDPARMRSIMVSAVRTCR